MVDAVVIVPEDLKTEIEAVSKREHRSEADVIRDAMRQYVSPAEATSRQHTTGTDSNVSPTPVGIDSYTKSPWMLDPSVPQSIGIASSGRVQSDEVDEWLENNWERDW